VLLFLKRGNKEFKDRSIYLLYQWLNIEKIPSEFESGYYML